MRISKSKSKPTRKNSIKKTRIDSQKKQKTSEEIDSIDNEIDSTISQTIQQAKQNSNVKEFLEIVEQTQQSNCNSNDEKDCNDESSQNSENRNSDSCNGPLLTEAQTGQCSEINNFFYSNNKFINQFEDLEMIEYIHKRFPKFDTSNSTDKDIKKAIIEILNDQKFVDDFLTYYNITIFDLFKFFYRIEPSIFKGLFIKRIQKAMKYKKYATRIKKCRYRAKKSVRRKSRRT